MSILKQSQGQTYSCLLRYKMSPGAVRSLAILAIVTTMIVPSVSAFDYNEKWGGSSGEKGLDNRFIVGNWKQSNEGRKHLGDPQGKIKKVVDVLETERRGGRSMERENDRTQQKRGNSVGKGVDNCSWIGSPRQMDTHNVEPSHATLPQRDKEQLLMLSFCRLKSSKYSKYSNIRAGSHNLSSKHCNTFASYSPQGQGCRVKRAGIDYKNRGNGTFTDFTCSCKVIKVPNISNEDCCNYACCKEILKIANRCGGNFSHSYDCNADVFGERSVEHKPN